LTISVITPSYNQSQFLKKCLESVKSQTYKPIEHLVFDPGSTDGSIDIVKSYDNITLYNEPDNGQSDAINKGFKKAKGDIIAWINSDDYYVDETIFKTVIKRFKESDSPDIIYGKGIYVDENNNKLRDAYINKNPETLHKRLHHEVGIMQPALFLKKSVIDKVGYLRDDLHFSMDYELWIRCIKSDIKFTFIDKILASASYHTANKTYGQRGNSYEEVCKMTKEHYQAVSPIWIKRYAEFLSDGYDGVIESANKQGYNDLPKYNELYKDLMVRFNGDKMTLDFLSQHKENELFLNIYNEMKDIIN
jgi:glycosyltransferase involved in cell wall biosynthesis